MTRHSFSGHAVSTTLVSQMLSADTTASVVSTTGWPDTSVGPFVITIDRGTATEEKVLIRAFTGGSLTVQSRGYDGTTAVTHKAGALVEHTLDATQIDLHDSVIAAVGTITPSTSAVGDSASDGTALTAPAAGDHKHAREAFGTSATVSAVGDTQAPGTAATPARSDHKHGREAFGIAVSTSTPGDVGTIGVATTLARSDHQHTRETLVATSSTRPGSPYTGQIIFETDTNRLAVYNGSVWLYNFLPSNPAGRAHQTSGQTISDITATLITNMTQDWANGGITFASNVFTIHTAGIYHVTGSIQWPGVNVAPPSFLYETTLYKNGSQMGAEISNSLNATAGTTTVILSDDLQLSVNDTIGLGGFQASGANRTTTANATYLALHLVSQ